MLKTGMRVNSIYGPGEVIKDNTEVISARIKRYCVHLDNVPDSFMDMDKRNGGIMFFEDELEVIKST